MTRAERVGGDDTHGGLGGRARFGEGEVHPVGAVGVDGMPDAANLQVGIFVDERLFFAGLGGSGISGWLLRGFGDARVMRRWNEEAELGASCNRCCPNDWSVQNLRGGLELHVGNGLPVVGESLGDNEFGTDGCVVRGTVVVIVCHRSEFESVCKARAPTMVVCHLIVVSLEFQLDCIR